MQFSRYGRYHEYTYRCWFSRPFAFEDFNKGVLDSCGSGDYVLAFDPSHIRKSGKHTYGKGKFWSGCDQAMKPGLEIAGFAVVDVKLKTAFQWRSFQTPSPACLKEKQQTLMEHYISLWKNNAEKLLKISKYVAVDAYFSKSNFVKEITDMGFEMVSRLRSDAVLYYPYQGKPTGKRGRPKQFDGRVVLDKPDEQYLKEIIADETMRVHSGVVYVQSLKRKVQVAIVSYLKPDKSVKCRKIYFSTDIAIDPVKLLEYYKLRFQIEFLYRDAKQHTGLEACQARDEAKLDFHTNTALTVVSLAKATHWADKNDSELPPFSVTDLKVLYHNQLLIDRFICMFEIDPNIKENKDKIKLLADFGRLAA